MSRFHTRFNECDANHEGQLTSDQDMITQCFCWILCKFNCTVNKREGYFNGLLDGLDNVRREVWCVRERERGKREKDGGGRERVKEIDRERERRTKRQTQRQRYKGERDRNGKTTDHLHSCGFRPVYFWCCIILRA